MSHGILRRSFLRVVLGAATAALSGLGCGDDGHGTTELPAPVVRRSASELTDEEIDRFRRAFEYAVARGYFDAFNDSHHSHHHQRHHGADVLATSPMTIAVMPRTWGFRLLPWHRSFLIEAELMLRDALRERDAAEGRDPAEADLLFIPYWDAAHDQGLPDWVLEFQPKGGTAPVPEGLPEGHAGYGIPVGERHDIEFGRWPGQNPVFDTLHTPDYIGRILAHPDFEGFYDALDTNPELVLANAGRAMSGMATLAAMRPDDAAVQTLLMSLGTPPADADAQVATTNALFELAHLAAVETRKSTPDAALVAAIKDVYSVFNFMPHLRMHLWAGGLHPEDAGVRGTVTYFHELTVDPVFWMLHAELDRVWYTWEEANEGAPPLTGEDAEFAPMHEGGDRYGGGLAFTLDELTDHAGLPYTYDLPFTE